MALRVNYYLSGLWSCRGGMTYNRLIAPNVVPPLSTALTGHNYYPQSNTVANNYKNNGSSCKTILGS